MRKWEPIIIPFRINAYTFENPEVTISAGQAISSAASLSIADDSEFVPGRVYLIPVTIKSATGDLDIIEAGRTIFLKVSRTLRFHAPYVGQASMAYQFYFQSLFLHCLLIHGK